MNSAQAGSSERNQGSPEQGQGSSANKAASPPAQQAAPAEAGATQGGGGSSPVLPILIALAVLAAISIGALLIRHHRQGADGGRLSTKAG